MKIDYPFLSKDVVKVEITSTKRAVLFTISCPYLNRSIALYEDTWKYKICDMHNEVKGCLNFVKTVLSNEKSNNVCVYRKKDITDKLAVYYKDCPNLRPRYEYLKIGIELISVTEAVITTCHGQNGQIGLSMEEVK